MEAKQIIEAIADTIREVGAGCEEDEGFFLFVGTEEGNPDKVEQVVAIQRREGR